MVDQDKFQFECPTCGQLTTVFATVGTDPAKLMLSCQHDGLRKVQLMTLISVQRGN